MQARSQQATVVLAGDTMLGRGVAERLSAGSSPQALVDDEVAALMRGADACVVNLECCVSARGEPWSAPGKPFFFRAPPEAVDLLVHLGVDCVTLANNHALDFGVEALLDTLHHLDSAGVQVVGAGVDEQTARGPARLQAGPLSVGVVGVTDHPAEFAAGQQAPGVAYADLAHGVPVWLTETLAGLADDTDCVLVTPHWGPNMVSRPLASVRRAAERLVGAGAAVVAGHSAHVFHGVTVAGVTVGRETVGRGDPRGPCAVLYDLGDFLDDYAVDPALRNDLGLLALITVGREGPRRLELVPLRLDRCHTRPATGEDAAWVRRRFRAACADLGTDVEVCDGRLVVTLT